MSEKKSVPLRKCMGCGEMKTKSELIRIVRTSDGSVEIDGSFKKNGRGAYVCKNAECLEKIRKSGRLSRSLSPKIPDGIYDACEEVISKNE